MMYLVTMLHVRCASLKYPYSKCFYLWPLKVVTIGKDAGTGTLERGLNSAQSKTVFSNLLIA